MHEASLTSDLLRRIEEIVAAEKAVRVAQVSVWIGALSHMSASHFAEHFKRAARGSVAEGAALKVTVSDDVEHARAQDIVLESVEIET
jgi:hydrogenase nickel incorporation protein HypA/HybF